jgi:hypothetical protein
MNLLVDHFMACRTPADFYRLQILAECDALPADLAVLVGHRDVLPREAVTWMENIQGMMFAQATAVQPFRRRLISRNVALYTTRRAPDEPRDLLVAFCGLADRMQVPIPVVLQHLDGRRFDVLRLRDPSKRIYLQGVPAYAADLALVAERIRRDVDLDRYGSIRTIGTSGGGWAAFTVGTMLGADRAVSMSGKPPGATFRLTQMWERRGYALDDQNADFTVFERLFNSIPVRSTRLLAFFGAGCQPDREGAEAFERLVGAVGIGVREVNDHNLMFEILKRRLMATFLDRYLTGNLDEVVPPPGERLLDFGNFEPPAARHDPGATGRQALNAD